MILVDERAKRTGAYIELLGTYNPLTEPKDIKLKQDRIDYWIKQGAQPSLGFLRMIGKAPQRPPRKPKKAASAESYGEPKEKKEKVPANTSDGGSMSEAKADSSEVKTEEEAEESEKKDEGSA